MKTTSTVFLALMAASGVVSGPLQKRAEVTVTTTETILVTVTVDGHHKGPMEEATTTETETTMEASETTAETTTEEAPAAEETTATTTTEEAPAAEETTDGTTTASDSTATSSTGDDFIDASLNHHNIHRANHSSADLTWNEDIAGYAAITAATCTFAHDTETGGGGYGQNLAMWASSGDVRETGEAVFIGRSITEMWYNGELELFPESEYGLDSPDTSDFASWGHYTQVIWADTTSVGCAVQYCEPGTMVDGLGAYFSVCNYSPAGNVGGGFATNVLPPQGDAIFNAP